MRVLHIEDSEQMPRLTPEKRAETVLTSVLFGSKRLALLGGAAIVLAAAPAMAAGFGVPEISAEGLGRANAGEAARHGAAALWWNPAAVAAGRAEASANLSYRMVSSHLTDAGSTITRPIAPGGLTLPVGGRSRASGFQPDAALPEASLAVPLAGGVTVGVALTQPFHLKTSFPDASWTRYDTLRSRIDGFSLQGGLAVPLASWLDVGAAFEAQHMAAHLDSASPNLDPAAADAVQHLDGSGWDYGWTVGAQAHSDRLRVGVSYRAAIQHRLSGRIALSGLQAPLDAANFDAPARTVFWTPSTLAVAAQWQATPEWLLSAQVVRSDWSKYDKIDVTFAGASASIPQGFHSKTSVALGADYRLTDTWTLRGGVQHDPTPSPDALREPGVPDADRWMYTLGASRSLAGRAKLSAAVAYSDFANAPVNDENDFYAGTPAQSSASLHGRYSGHQVSVSLGFDASF